MLGLGLGIPQIAARGFGVPQFQYFNGVLGRLLTGADGQPLQGADGQYLYGVA